MMLRVSDLRHKDIVNITDGRRLGYIRDVDIDLQAGQINAVVIPGEAGFFSFFARGDDMVMVIPWRQIKRIGVDVILVELTQQMPKQRFMRRREEEFEKESPLPLALFRDLPEDIVILPQGDDK